MRVIAIFCFAKNQYLNFDQKIKKKHRKYYISSLTVQDDVGVSGNRVGLLGI